MLRALLPALALALAGSLFGQTDAGNRFSHLDTDNPFWPNVDSPKLVTPQWIGEAGTDAAVILAIDDMRENALPKYEAFLRPILDELKKDGGRAPLSIMTCTARPEDPQLQAWIREGVSIEAHTLKHPCPLLQGGDLASARETVDGCIDLLNRIPHNRPVAFRTPCCDSMSTPSPRVFSEILAQTTPAGNFLAIDSSVMTLITPRDKSLPREIVFDRNGQERFAKYFPSTPGKDGTPPTGRKSLANFGTWIADYPYPYVVHRTLWEFPCMVPSDWEAFNAHGANQPATLEDWKAALDAVVLKQGVFTFVFHPHGWIQAEQMVAFIRYAREKYGKRVKFLNFREAAERLDRNLLAGHPLRTPEGKSNSWSTLADLDGDGFMDVITGRGPLEPGQAPSSTRVWQPASKTWQTTLHAGDSGLPDEHALAMLEGKAVSVTGPHGASNGEVTLLNYIPASPLDLKPLGQGALSLKLPAEDPFRGMMARDLDHDGSSELLLASASRTQIFRWSAPEGSPTQSRSWQPLPFELPAGVALFDASGRDNGVRFIDLNGDGHDDIVFSNAERYGVYLFNPIEKKNVDWRLGWTFVLREGKAGDPNSLPPIVRLDGTGNGVWFAHGAMWVQNEDTSALPDKVRRIPFADLLRQPGPPPRAPEESLKAIHLKKGFKAELVAAEPLVQDPVYVDWDAKGRMWVVEMGDYPFHDEPRNAAGELLFEEKEPKSPLRAGRVKILEDTNGDGIYDKATLFLDGLKYPTGLAHWKNGVFIASVPEVFFVEEKDGKPGKRTTILSGFTLGNPQHLVNGFCWGLDGWFYGGNGDSGGNVVEAKSGKTFDLSGRDFRFHPETGEFQLIAGRTQYGRWRDDFGNWFGCNNSSMGWHYFMDERYIARNPKLAVPALRRMLKNEPDKLRIFPVSAPVRRLNWPDAVNTLTSGCNAMPYRDTLLGEEYTRSFFICEPANNLVHREVLEPDGISFRSHRAVDEKDYEFLASEDNWSRFTQARTGPDGCLYVVDMYRQVIEHPEWIPKAMLAHLDLRGGEDRGRIYRIRPEDKAPRQVQALDRATPGSLAYALESPNGWTRDTAQRLLLEKFRVDAQALEPREKLATETASPEKSFTQRLASLRGMGTLTPEHLATFLRYEDPRVRRHAVELTEPFLNERSLTETIIRLAGDPDLRVRVQVALTLGESTDPRVPDVLRSLAKGDGDNPDMLIALLSSVPKHEAVLAEDAKAWQAKLKELMKNNSGSKAPVQIITHHNPDRDKVVKEYTPAVAALKGDAARGHALYKNICAACHKLKNEGAEIGPDLGTIAGKPTEQLVEAIMDPSRAVEMRYLAQNLRLKDGRDVVAMIAEETANSLTLRTAAGTEVVLKGDVTSRQTSTKSVMPEGLESVLTPQFVADILAWIRAK